MDDLAPTHRRRAFVLGLAVTGGFALATGMAVVALPGSGGSGRDDRAIRLTAADDTTSTVATSTTSEDRPRGDDATSTVPTTATSEDGPRDDGSTSTLPGSSTTATTPTTGAPTPVAGVPPTGPTAEVAAADAGVVVLGAGDPLTVVEARPAAGWTASIEVASGREVEVTFRSGSARVDLRAEREDGAVRVRVRDRRTGQEIEYFPITPPTTTPPPATAPPTAAPPTAAPPTAAPPTGSPTTTAPPPAPAPPTTSPAPQQITRSAAGGTVTVSVGSGGLSLVSAAPTAGWSMEVHHAGPDEVDVRFESGDHESRVRFEREDGGVRERVEDR